MIEKVAVEGLQTEKLMKLMSLFEGTDYSAFIDSAEGRTYLRIRKGE